jgi:hypothetical protein
VQLEEVCRARGAAPREADDALHVLVLFDDAAGGQRDHVGVVVGVRGDERLGVRDGRILGAADDPVHHRHGLDGIPPDGRLAAEHERVGEIPHGVGHV